MDIINIKNVNFTYQDDNASKSLIDHRALKDINLDIPKGKFYSVIGRNGSGKSTLARIINGLLLPTDGVCYVNNIDTRDAEMIWEIRKTCGMVFQNPDNQIIGTSVEEDVAFGLENIGVPHPEMINRMQEAMDCVGISEYRDRAPHLLSGGQKQRVAIAGILAMRPECIILDEATAMLDPIGRREVMEVVQNLNRDYGITILHITHHMDEARLADKVIVIDNGEIIMVGTPKEVFSKIDTIKKIGLDVPQITELFNALIKEGYDLPGDVTSEIEAIEYIKKYL